MEAMLAYLLKVSVSAILFYLFIRILMERETQHEYIRGLWIGAIVFSLVLPFIYVPVPDLFPEKAEAAESMENLPLAEVFHGRNHADQSRGKYVCPVSVHGVSFGPFIYAKREHFL